MVGRTKVLLRPLLAGMLLLALPSCAESGGDDTVDGQEAEATLVQQRTDVREAAETLLREAEKSLPGATANSVGRWDGCESAFNDQFKNFQYVAQARVDAAPDAATPYLDAVRPVLEAAGFAVAQVEQPTSGRASLEGRNGDLTAVFVDTGGPFVGLDVFGPCIEVPEGDREAWLRRDEPSPNLL